MGAPPSPAHEGMQLYSTPVHEGLQPVEGNPYAYSPGTNPSIEPDEIPLSTHGGEPKYDRAPLPPYPGRRICGVASRVFWTIFGVAILLIVIAAAVGGGVGGSQAARHAKEAANKAANASPDLLLNPTTTPVDSSSPKPISSSTQPSSSLTSESSPTTSETTSATSSITTSSPSSTSASKSSSTISSTKTSSSAGGATPVSISGTVPLDCPKIDGTTYKSTESVKISFSITCGSTIDNADIGRTMAPSIEVCMEDCVGYPSGDCKAIVFNANMTMATSLAGNCLFKNSTSGLHTGSYKLQASAIIKTRG